MLNNNNNKLKLVDFENLFFTMSFTLFFYTMLNFSTSKMFYSFLFFILKPLHKKIITLAFPITMLMLLLIYRQLFTAILNSK